MNDSLHVDLTADSSQLTAAAQQGDDAVDQLAASIGKITSQFGALGTASQASAGQIDISARSYDALKANVESARAAIANSIATQNQATASLQKLGAVTKDNIEAISAQKAAFVEAQKEEQQALQQFSTAASQLASRRIAEIKAQAAAQQMSVEQEKAALAELKLSLEGSSVAMGEVDAAMDSVTISARTMGAEMNQVAGNAARMGGALGVGAAAGRVAAFAGSLESLKAAALPLIGILAGFTLAFEGFQALKNGVASAESMESSLTTLRAAVEAQGASWNDASAAIKNFLDTESLASGFTQGELVSSFNRLVVAGASVSDAMKIISVADEEAIATHTSLASVVALLMEAEGARASGLERLDPRIKDIIKSGGTLAGVLTDLHRLNKDQVNDLNDTAQATNRAKVAWDDATRTLGEHFLPAITDFDYALIGLLHEMPEWGSAMGGVFVSLGNVIADVVKEAISNLGHLFKAAMDGVAGVALLEQHQVGAAGIAFGAASNEWKAIPLNPFGTPQIQRDLAGLAGSEDIYNAVKTLNLEQIGKGLVQSAVGTHGRGTDVDFNPQVGTQRGGSGSSRSSASSTHVAESYASALSQVNNELSKNKALLEGSTTGTDALAAEYQRARSSGVGLTQAITDLRAVMANETSDQSDFTDALHTVKNALAYADEQLTTFKNGLKGGAALTAAQKNELDKLTKAATDAATAVTALTKASNQNAVSLKQHTGDVADLTKEQKNQDDQAARNAQHSYEEQLRTISEFADKATSFFDSIFTKGKDGASGLATAFKTMVADMEKALEKSALMELLGKLFGVNVGGFGNLFEQNLLGLKPGQSLGPASAGSDGLALAGAQSMANAYMGSGGGILGRAGSALGFGGGGLVAPGTLQGAADIPGASYAPIADGTLPAVVGSGQVPAIGGSASGAFGLGSKLFGGAGGAGAVSVGSLAAAGVGGAIIGQTVFGGKGFADMGGAVGGMAALAFAGPAGWAAIAAMALGGALLGGEGGSLFGDHFSKADEPDIYAQQAWGQELADLQGKTASDPMNASGAQFTMDSNTDQLTQGKGWNVMMEDFVQSFSGKEDELPASLAGIFPQIKSLWGGATNQANFNNDGKNGNLDIGSGQTAGYGTFWGIISTYGNAIANLMHEYTPTQSYAASISGQVAPIANYNPTGSPDIVHQINDTSAPIPMPTKTSPPVVSGGAPIVKGGYGGGNYVGGGANGAPAVSPPDRMTQTTVVNVNNYINGSVVASRDLDNTVFTSVANSSSRGATAVRSMNVRRQ